MKATQWMGKDDNQWSLIGDVTPRLEPGFYNIRFGFGGWSLAAHKPEHDNIIQTGIASRICADIDKFWAAAPTYRKFGFLHKRGVLMIGYPGTGKSMTAMLLCRHIVGAGGVAIVPHPDFDYFNVCVSAICSIRDIHPNMPIMILLEDVEEAYSEAPEALLAFMDGQHQINNVIFAATTNFPEKLDSRLLDRPGRFDDVVWVGPPDAATRYAYLQGVIPADAMKEPHDRIRLLDEMVAATDGFLLSHLREMVSLVFVLGRSVKEAAATINEISNRSKANDKAKETVLSNNPAVAALLKQRAVA